MAKQTINIGASPNDGTGTPLRTSFDYCNQNFTELYTATGPSGNNIVVPGSATITGDLTVDTSTLKVDSANNRVGIGTASPSYILDIIGASPRLHIRDNGTGSSLLDIENGAGTFYVGRENSTGSGGLSGVPYAGILYLQGAYPIIFGTNFTERYRIASDGVATWSNVGGVAGTAMTLNSTGLGVGASPGERLTIQTALTGTTVGSNTVGRFQSNGSGYDAHIALGDNVNPSARIGYLSSAMYFWTNGAERARIDSSGNVGVGVAPSTSRFLVKGDGTNIPVKIIGTTGDTTIPHLVIDKKDNNTTTSQLFIQFVVADNGAGSGQINANGVNQAAFGTYSDSRLKKNIVNLPSQLANILSLRPVEFDYKDGNGHQIGFIAQEMQEVYADAVGEQEGFLTVSGWNKTEARLVSAIKELAAKVQALEAKLA